MIKNTTLSQLLYLSVPKVDLIGKLNITKDIHMNQVETEPQWKRNVNRNESEIFGQISYGDYL